MLAKYEIVSLKAVVPDDFPTYAISMHSTRHQYKMDMFVKQPFCKTYICVCVWGGGGGGGKGDFTYVAGFHSHQC